MALDPRYIPLTGLWQLFSDKDTGNFLRNGYVKFWRDTARTVGKEIFQITGSPPNYTYIQYGFLDTDGSWRIDLNDQGAFDLIPYAFPYDDTGAVDLYFVKVYSAEDVEQFSREGIPNVEGETPSNTEVDVNYVPNPQFLLHSNLPATQTLQAGQIRQAVTNIAYGGWTFERPVSSTATDFVTFERFGSDVENPEKSPRYALRVRCENPGAGDTFKDIRLKFKDVNKFSFSADKFTYGIFAQVNSLSSISATLVLIKNYGTGGSAPDEITIGNLVIGSAYSLVYSSFLFGDNASKTIGLLDDDYLQIAIRLPVGSIFDVSFVDANLAKGDLVTPSMPYTTNSQMIYRSLSGFMPVPAYDGSDLYLTPRLTPNGMEFDRSNIGKIYASSYPTLEVGELWADGSQYETAGYSSDGIPYARLQSKWFQGDKGLPIYGTGRQFVSTYYINGNPSASLTVNNNGVGTATNFSDGSPATTFTFTPVTVGTDTQSWGLYRGTNSFYIWGKLTGAHDDTGATVGTSGFTVNVLRNGRPTVEVVFTKCIYEIQTIAATTLAGKYFTFNNTTTQFAIWFKVDGAGSAPSVPGATLIEVDLVSTWSASEVAQVIAATVSGSKITLVGCKAASFVPAGSYWNLHTATQDYYVWYKKDGVGTDPAPPGKLPILVHIQTGYTDIQVSTFTLLAINTKYFSVPDLRGMFLRGVDNGAGIDTDNATRWTFFNQSIYSGHGDMTGSFEFDEITQHLHKTTVDNGGAIARVASADGLNNPVEGVNLAYTLSSGGSESRPVNAYVNWVVKY